jgi:hypothetical protein
MTDEEISDIQETTAARWKELLNSDEMGRVVI